jgi:hypothetical protein
MSSNYVLLIGKVLAASFLLFLGACISALCTFYVAGRGEFLAVPCGQDSFNSAAESIILVILILTSFGFGTISFLVSAYAKLKSLKQIITVVATQLVSAFIAYGYLTWPNVFIVAPICE